MSEVEELEVRIMNLPRQDLAKLRDWFLELDNQLWDQQIAADVDVSPKHQHAFLYDGAATIDLGTLGGSESSATAINGSGVVVGVSTIDQAGGIRVAGVPSLGLVVDGARDLDEAPG